MVLNEEEKHVLGILVENILYDQLRDFDKIDFDSPEQMKILEDFIDNECKVFEHIDRKIIKEFCINIVNRTDKNMKKIRDGNDGR